MRRTRLLLGLFVGFLAACAAGAAQAMTATEIVRLLDAGIGESVILDQVQAEGLAARLTSEEIVALKEAGASDDFLRALIRAGTNATQGRDSVTGSRGELDEEWTERYASPLTRVEIYYDPFGYYWYSWPAAYAYYDPFRWLDCGFYYAGWWDHRWWRYGPYCDHYRGIYWHWDHPRPPIGPPRDGRTHHGWTRTSRDDRTPAHRSPERDRNWGRDRDRGGRRTATVGPPGGIRHGSSGGSDRRPDRSGSGRSPDRDGSGRTTPPRTGWKR